MFNIELKNGVMSVTTNEPLKMKELLSLAMSEDSVSKRVSKPSTATQKSLDALKYRHTDGKVSPNGNPRNTECPSCGKMVRGKAGLGIHLRRTHNVVTKKKEYLKIENQTPATQDVIISGGGGGWIH